MRRTLGRARRVTGAYDSLPLAAELKVKFRDTDRRIHPDQDGPAALSRPVIARGPETGSRSKDQPERLSPTSERQRDVCGARSTRDQTEGG
jgi:hypothetical protein